MRRSKTSAAKSSCQDERSWLRLAEKKSGGELRLATADDLIR